MIKHKGGIFSAGIEQRHIEAGFFAAGDLIHQGKQAFQILNLMGRLTHGAQAVAVKFQTGNDKIIGGTAGSESRLVQRDGDRSDMGHLNDLRIYQFAQYGQFPVIQFTG